MSNLVKKIQKNVEANKKARQYYVESCLVGTAMLSIGKLAGLSESEIVEKFYEIKDDFPEVKNIQEMCNFLIKYLGMPEGYKDRIVLIYDENELYGPLITIEVDECYLPVSESGIYPAIMRNLDQDNIQVEKVFEDEA